MSGADLPPAGSAPPPPVDTLEPPHEPVVTNPSTVGMWSVVLAGPVIWIAHFMFVYLFAEASCESSRSEVMGFVGPGVLRWSVIAATLIGAVLCVASGWQAWRRRHHSGHRELMVVGTMMSIGAALSVLAVGLPVAAVGPC